MLLKAFIGGTTCIYGAVLLLGAPIFSETLNSLGMCALLAMCTAVPWCCRFGSVVRPDAYGCVRVVKLWPATPEELKVCLPGYSATIGAWVGACAGPLDWETAWQHWPAASCYGACGGYAVGTLLAVICTA